MTGPEQGESGESRSEREVSLPAGTGAPPRMREPLGAPFWIFLSFLTLVAAGLIVYFSILRQVDRTVEKATDTVDKVVDTAKETFVEIAERFRPELVVATFHEWRELTVSSGTGSQLEIATAEASERFTRTTSYRVFGKTVPQSINVSEIVVPATYRFHIDLNESWDLRADGKRLVVTAPRIRPTLPVAFDTAGMEKKTTAGWARWDGDDDIAELEKGITEELGVRASSPETIAKIEDEGRLAVARFVRTWLLTQEAWGEGKFEEIHVRFEGETGRPGVTPPALRLDAAETRP